MQTTCYRTCVRALSLFLLLAPITAPNTSKGQFIVVEPQKVDRSDNRDRAIKKLTLPKDRVDPAIADAANLELTFIDEVLASKTDLNAVRLVAEGVTVQQSKDLVQLLESRGIKWNARSVSLIYDLNPTLADVRSVSEGATLVLPKIIGDSLLDRLLTGRPIVAVSSKEEEPSKIARAKQKALGELSHLLRKIPLFHFRRPQVKGILIKLVDSARHSLSFLDPEKRPTSRNALRQSSAEAEELEEIVLGSVNENRASSTATQKEAAELSFAIANRANEIRAGRSGLVTVEVHTVSKDRRPIGGLRVFYRPKRDNENKYLSKFGNLSTPTSEALAIGATLTLWAGEGDDPRPVSDHLTIKVNSQGNRSFELIVGK